MVYGWSKTVNDELRVSRGPWDFQRSQRMTCRRLGEPLKDGCGRIGMKARSDVQIRKPGSIEIFGEMWVMLREVIPLHGSLKCYATNCQMS